MSTTGAAPTPTTTRSAGTVSPASVTTLVTDPRRPGELAHPGPQSQIHPVLAVQVREHRAELVAERRT